MSLATTPSATDRLPPANIDAERSLLGSLLIDPDAIERVLTDVRSQDFYREAHRHIYDAVVRLYLEDTPPDYVSVCDQLRRSDRLDAAGGEDRVVELASAVPTPFHVEHYAGIVVRAARLRDVIRLSTDLVAGAYQPDADPEALAEVGLAALEKLHRGAGADWGFVPLSQDLPAERDRIEQAMALYESGESPGLPTNFPKIDQAGLLMPGELVVLAAEPGVGKTALLLNLVERYASQGLGVLLAEFEMSPSEVLQRLIGLLEGVWVTRLRTGNLEDQHYDKAVRAMGRIDPWPVWRTHGGIPSAETLRRMVRRHLRNDQGAVLLVDYLQLMRGDPTTGRETEANLLGEMSKTLKRLAVEQNLLVLAVSSVNRKGDRPVADLDRIRGSGQIAFDADWVLTMGSEAKRQHLEPKPVVARHLTISKARHGMSNVRQWLAFDKPHQRITPISRAEEVDSWDEQGMG